MGLPSLQRALFGIKQAAGRRAVPFWLLTRVPGSTRRRTVGARTDLTIEGFPRSGNSFAEHAFRMAQPQPVRLAEHHHKPAHITRSIRLGIPTLVLIREPLGAVSSVLVFYPWMSPRQALAWYVSFHRHVERVADDIVLADFEEVIGDFAVPIRQVNRRFGTSFVEFDHTPDNERAVFARLDEQNQELGNSHLRVSRPIAERAERKEELAASLEHPALAQLLAAAQEVYSGLTARRVAAERAP